jgi:hypothetical protein
MNLSYRYCQWRLRISMLVSTPIYFSTKVTDLQRSELQVLMSPFLSLSKMVQAITISICIWEMPSWNFGWYNQPSWQQLICFCLSWIVIYKHVCHLKDFLHFPSFPQWKSTRLSMYYPVKSCPYVNSMSTNIYMIYLPCHCCVDWDPCLAAITWRAVNTNN